jgi:hypothetical protein
MRFYDATDEEAFEIWAELMDPIEEMAQDQELVLCLKNRRFMKAVKFALKRHAKKLREIFAICEGVPLAEYHPKPADIPTMLIKLVNHPDFQALFPVQIQNTASPFGSAMESTEDSEN